MALEFGGKQQFVSQTNALTTIISASGVALADSHEEAEQGPSFVPAETWACNFRDGKGMSDLMAFTEKFNAWLDDEEYTDYFAAIVTPSYFGEKKMDVGWLGAWTNGNAMGAGTDMWLADGGELGAEFIGIVDCGE